MGDISLLLLITSGGGGGSAEVNKIQGPLNIRGLYRGDDAIQEHVEHVAETNIDH